MATKYRIEIHDYENDNHPTLYGWTDPEQAAEAAWTLLEAAAKNRDLDYENQGDQFMAFNKDGHPEAGLGVITMQVINEDTGDYYEL